MINNNNTNELAHFSIHFKKLGFIPDGYINHAARLFPDPRNVSFDMFQKFLIDIGVTYNVDVGTYNCNREYVLSFSHPNDNVVKNRVDFSEKLQLYDFARFLAKSNMPLEIKYVKIVLKALGREWDEMELKNAWEDFVTSEIYRHMKSI